MYVSDYWKHFKPIDMKWHYLNALIYALIGIFGLVANIMVILYIIKIKKSNRSRSKSGLLFLTNLAIADIFKVLINLPMNAISSFKGRWVFEQLGCDIYGLAGGLFGFISITTLVFMAIERYHIVKNPLDMAYFGKKMKLACILFTWIYSTFLITLQLFSKNGFVLEGFLTSCSFDYLSRDLYSRIYMLIMFIGGFIVPLIIIITFYLLTKIEINSKNEYLIRINSVEHYQNNKKNKNNNNSKRSFSFKSLISQKNSKHLDSCKYSSSFVSDSFKKSLKFKQNKFSKESTFSKNSNSSSKQTQSYLLLKRENKVLKRIILNLSLFCLAWLPYAVVTLLAQFGNNIQTYLTPYTTSLPAILAKISSIYNPIIYTLTNKDCQTYFKKFLKIN